MKCELSADCGNCSLGETRDTMIANWQSFEEGVASNPNAQLTAEGQFLCSRGPRKWSLGPLVLGYSCRADKNQAPQAELIDQD